MRPHGVQFCCFVDEIRRFEHLSPILIPLVLNPSFFGSSVVLNSTKKVLAARTKTRMRISSSLLIVIVLSNRGELKSELVEMCLFEEIETLKWLTSVIMIKT
jgi:hypothetical protein